MTHGWARVVVCSNRLMCVPSGIHCDIRNLIMQEYAGLPGSSKHAKYLKSTTHTQLSRALYPGSSIVSMTQPHPLIADRKHYSLTSLTTLLYPLSSMTELPDRTYVGGPNSLRGFKVGGLGLRDGNDSLGGDMGWGLGLSVFTPFWNRAHWPVRVHSFVNAGKVVGYDKSEQTQVE
jgi:outer membrane protein insertion porin family